MRVEWLQTKAGRLMRTNQQHLQDGHRASTTLFTLRFEAIKTMAAKRVPPVRPQLSANVGVKNTKHLAVLAENGINYDRPMSPVQVATLRAERIAREKKNAAAAGTTSVCCICVCCILDYYCYHLAIRIRISSSIRIPGLAPFNQ